jgi:hypothetical protein
MDMATVGVGARVDVAGRGVGVDVGGGSVGVDVEGSGVGVDVDGGGEGRGVEGTAVCIRPGSWFCVAHALNTTATKKLTKRFIVSYLFLLSGSLAKSPKHESCGQH